MVDQQATSAEPKATDSIATSYLNTENIARSNAGIEYHPLRPFLPCIGKTIHHSNKIYSFIQISLYFTKILLYNIQSCALRVTAAFHGK